MSQAKNCKIIKKRRIKQRISNYAQLLHAFTFITPFGRYISIDALFSYPGCNLTYQETRDKKILGVMLKSHDQLLI